MSLGDDRQKGSKGSGKEDMDIIHYWDLETTPGESSIETDPEIEIEIIDPFFHLSSLRRAIPVLSEPLELVSLQFFSAWVEDMQRQGQKKREDIIFLLMNFMV